MAVIVSSHLPNKDQSAKGLQMLTLLINISSYVVHTTTVSLQLGAGIDRHFARETVEMFFAALGLFSLRHLRHLLLNTCGAPLSVRVWGWTGGRAAPLHRWTVWRWIRKLRARGDLWGKLRRPERGRVCAWRLWGRSECQWALLDIFWLLLCNLRRSTWACRQMNKHRSCPMSQFTLGLTIWYLSWHIIWIRINLCEGKI